MLVRVAWADLVSVFLDSILVQSVGEPVFGHMSPSRRCNGLERGYSISVRGSPSPGLGRGGKMKVCSCWEWQGDVGDCGEWG